MHIVANHLSILEELCRINLLFGCSLNKGKIPVKWPEKRIRVPPAKNLDIFRSGEQFEIAVKL